MKNKKFNKIGLSLALVLFVALVAAPVFAQTATATPGTKASVSIQKMITRSDTAITQRITSLNTTVARVNSMQKLSATEKTSLTSSLQNEIAELTTLKTKIDAATDAATLKTDMQSITKSYRIYMLVLPQATIAAASDRVLTIVDSINAVVTKLQTRISQLPAGTSTTAIQASMADITAKLADATTQANAAVTETSSLAPDQGNTTTAASNTATLKDARTKIKTATADLTAARKDAGTVAKAIQSIKKPAATTTPAQ